MEGEKVETELEFQMTKGELAEYCVNVTVKGIWSQKLAVAVFGMLLLAGVGEGMLMAVMGKGWDIWGELCSAGVFLQAEYWLFRVFFCIGSAAGWDS